MTELVYESQIQTSDEISLVRVILLGEGKHQPNVGMNVEERKDFNIYKEKETKWE